MKTIVTICRQFCSGGLDTGKMLAEKLGVEFYDKELITLAAKKSGFTEDFFENVDEKPTNSLLYSIALGAPSMSGLFFQNNDFLTNDKLFGIQSDVINQIAKKGSCVIVGRCSDYILRDEPRHVRVYLHADMETRTERLLKTEPSIKEKDAEHILHKADKKRRNYYNYYTGREWDDLQNYDLVINTSKIGVENTVEQIIKYMEGLK